MKVRYDDTTIIASPRYLAALEEVLRAELQMMRAAQPLDAESWAWGQATVTDLANSRGVVFEFGDEDDRPAGHTSDVRVISEAA